jgi:cobalt-zinc-cadmium efflux system membrane fusion protein
MKRSLSSCLAFALLAGVLAGCDRGPAAGGGAAAPAICPEHQILESDCPFCHPDLVEKLGECKEHGVPEALCWICKPSMVIAYKAKGDWCGVHGLPESQCGICHPGRGEAHAKAIAGATGPAQPLPPGDVAVVADPDAPRRSRAPSAVCTTEKLRVELASPEIAKSAGFRFEKVGVRKVVETLPANAEFAFVQSTYARLASRVGGTIREVRKDLGDSVAQGDVLAVVEAPELGAAKAEILQAEVMVELWTRNHERERGLLERGLSTQREVISAETSLAESRVALTGAKQRLRNLGVPPEDIEKVVPGKDTSSLVEVRAPLAGIVVEREAVVGEVVDAAKTLFAVADTSKIWAMLDVPEADVSRVRLGQSAVVQVGGAHGERIAGKISWISPRVESGTRTVKARVEVPNPTGELRAGMFGTAEIRVHEGTPLPAVPKSAVQWEGCCNVVFLRKTDQVYLPRKVKLGADLGDFYAVESGVSEGDVVVTDGSFLLRTEIRKGSIGAGCCAGD